MRLELCAVALGLIAVTGAGCQKDCRAGTLFLDVDLGGADQADTLSLDVTIDGTTKHSDRSLPPGAHSSGGLEIAFPSGYPGGKTATVTLTALRVTVPIATTSKMIPLTGGCTHASMAFPAADAGADRPAPGDAGQGGSGDARSDGGGGGNGAGGRGGVGGAAGSGSGGAGVGGNPGMGGAGMGGAGMGGATVVGNCGTARDFFYGFQSSNEGFAVSTFVDMDQVNLAVSAPAGTPMPTLAYDGFTNEPGGGAASGSLRLGATFTDYNQYVDVIVNIAPPRMLSGRIACAQVRLTSGNYAGAVHLHASSGPMYDGYAGGPAPMLNLGAWTTIPLNFDAPVSRLGPWISSDVVEIGVQFFTGDPIPGVAYPAGAAMFHIDTITD